MTGVSGSGKTTIINLLSRFYDVSEGSVTIDGYDVRDVTLASLRRQMGVMLQDTFIFSGNVRENIRYGRLNATDGDVEAAAREACADHFIRMLSGGYDFEINEDASNLSQGQRQLITIARALLADRRMLILDEATSALDSESEHMVQKALDNLMLNRTSLIIAHRLSTVTHADAIAVMDDGRVVACDTHENLLETCPLYASMWAAHESVRDVA